jgi:hypothetical protein
MADVSGPLRVEVDGEVFEVAEDPDQAGGYTQAWISGLSQRHASCSPQDAVSGPQEAFASLSTASMLFPSGSLTKAL